jgi:hypothetical protein
MQPTADVHDPITDVCLPQAASVVNNATAFGSATQVMLTG